MGIWHGLCLSIGTCKILRQKKPCKGQELFHVERGKIYRKMNTVQKADFSFVVVIMGQIHPV